MPYPYDLAYIETMYQNRKQVSIVNGELEVIEEEE